MNEPASTSRLWWRRLDELTSEDEAALRAHPEFPAGYFDTLDPVERRSFLKVMGASMALAGVTACTRQPEEQIVPYVRPPEDVIPGKPLFFASALSFGGYGLGALVESHMGRPTKIEGNPEHPSSRGATDLFGQASILNLYDPDRSRVLLSNGQIGTWSAFVTALGAALDAERPTRGAGVRIVTGTVTSPTLARQMQAVLAAFPDARWIQHDPARGDGALRGALAALGEPVATRYDLTKAAVVLTLDADLFGWGPGRVAYARDFAARRAKAGDGADPRETNRLYAVEASLSLTGATADHRLPLKPSDVERFARDLARRLGVPVAGPAPAAEPGYAAWLDVVARDLEATRGASVVVAGEAAPAAVHALAHAINERLQNVGRTVFHTEPVEAVPVEQAAALRELAADMAGGKVRVLLVLGVNPVYTAPADLAFAEAMKAVPFRAHLGLNDDETAFLSHWHVPEAHPLESWSDVRGHDGTVSIVQPLIAPLYGGRSAHEVLAAVVGRPTAKPYDLVRETWRQRAGGAVADADFEVGWRKALHDGVVPGTAAALRTLRVRAGFDVATAVADGVADEHALEVQFRPDPTIWDGSFANNGWLQETPKPTTHLVWENALLVSPADAERFGLADGDVVELGLSGRSLRAPVWRSPGHAAGAVTLTLGYGRTRAGQVGTGIGYDAYRLRGSDAPWATSGLTLTKTAAHVELVTTQAHHEMRGLEERPLAREVTLATFAADPHAVQHDHPHVSLYARHEALDQGYAWGMTIDLGVCTGCSACVVACVAENNIPVVGRDQVARGREMHWIRVDRYHRGEPGNPGTIHQPVPCMQCENAPCEVVCPVGATVHSAEGLNDMVYNRCIGTRYCSNNCPYKVRRFNFFLYNDWETESLKLQRNPDVTVRSRGVMEKCTYCVQRINQARIEAKKEDRQIRDGEVVTACAQACPTRAITFGNINDPDAAVSKAKASARNYGMLTELNTFPRTTYLARIRNPNPELEEPSTEVHGHEPARA